MLTLGEAKNSRLQRIAGLCSSTEDWLELFNDSVRMLMEMGNFWNTVKRLTFCSHNNCLTSPRRVGTLLALNTCGHSIPPKNHWYQFNDVLPEDVNHWQQFGHGFGSCNHGFAAADNGTTSVFNQIPCLNDRYVRFYPIELGDVGKTITIFGIDGNGLVIRSLRTDGTFQDGVVLTLALPFVQTTFLVRRVDRVIKDPTDGPIYGYQFDGANLFALATYEPSETLPEYRTNCILTGGCGHRTGNCGCCSRQYTALVKLEFIPAQFDSDLIAIDNIDAIALAMQANKVSDAYEDAGAEVKMQRAVHRLNLALRNKLPVESTPARVHYQGTAHLTKLRIGYLR